jgi:hypothetical protein
MSEGFVVEQTYGGTAVASWVAGTPEKSVWTGIKLDGKPRIDIATWRCGRCGFLEQYAAGPGHQDESRRKLLRVMIIVAVVSGLALSIGAALLVASF